MRGLDEGYLGRSLDIGLVVYAKGLRYNLARTTRIKELERVHRANELGGSNRARSVYAG